MAHSIADDHTNPTQQHTVLLATDNKNSVLAEVVAGRTNRMAYSAYGHQSAQQEVMTRLGFNGELREMQTSWYLLGNGYRAYNPRLMRFHSPDSWSPFGKGGLNSYMYGRGDPANGSDPTGHVFLPVFSSLFDDFVRSIAVRSHAAITATQRMGKTLVSDASAKLDGFKKLTDSLNVKTPVSQTTTIPGRSGNTTLVLNQKPLSIPQTTTDMTLPTAPLSKQNPKQGWLNLGMDSKKGNTSTGHPSSYGPGTGGSQGAGYSQGSIPSSSKPYPPIDPKSLDTGSVRNKK